MRRLRGRGLRFGTSPERIAPESVTRVFRDAFTATSRVAVAKASLDQVWPASTRARKRRQPLMPESNRMRSRVKPRPRKNSPEMRPQAGHNRCDGVAANPRRNRGTPRPNRACPATPFIYCVFATRGGTAWVTNSTASSVPVPSGVGIVSLNGTSTRVPAIGASHTSMLRWAARYLIAARSAM